MIKSMTSRFSLLCNLVLHYVLTCKFYHSHFAFYGKDNSTVLPMKEQEVRKRYDAACNIVV